jgi:hypothetical protein
MLPIKDQPVFSTCFDHASDFLPEAGSIYLCATNDEVRTTHSAAWEGRSDINFARVEDESGSQFRIGATQYSLRSSRNLSTLLESVGRTQTVYIDITGLSYSVWAALLRASLSLGMDVRVVYVEPDSYTRSRAPVEGQIYDLSARILGISPLPGFATLSETPSREANFVALLGFEGARLRYAIEQAQPQQDRIIPIVGLPGFQPSYVFEAYLGNRGVLLETNSWTRVRYAPANCPFRCAYILEDISNRNPDWVTQVALVGTKPHALGAVLFALTTQRAVELMHDHPVHSIGRTSGTSRLFVYRVASFARRKVATTVAG